MKIKITTSHEDINEAIQECIKSHTDSNEYPNYTPCDLCSKEGQCRILKVMQQDCNFKYTYKPKDLDEFRIQQMIKQSEKEFEVF